MQYVFLLLLVFGFVLLLLAMAGAVSVQMTGSPVAAPFAGIVVLIVILGIVRFVPFRRN